MRAVFLDIDGVLNHRALYSSLNWKVGHADPVDWIDPVCVARINSLCERADAGIVISSSWRIYLQTYDAVAGVLRRAGLTAEVIGATPVHGDPADEDGNLRWSEICAWLHLHPECSSWVIVDDVAWDGFPADRFVQTDIVVGITDGDVDRAVALLEIDR